MQSKSDFREITETSIAQHFKELSMLTWELFAKIKNIIARVFFLSTIASSHFIFQVVQFSKSNTNSAVQAE